MEAIENGLGQGGRHIRIGSLSGAETRRLSPSETSRASWAGSYNPGRSGYAGDAPEQIGDGKRTLSGFLAILARESRAQRDILGRFGIEDFPLTWGPVEMSRTMISGRRAQLAWRIAQGRTSTTDSQTTPFARYRLAIRSRSRAEGPPRGQSLHLVKRAGAQQVVLHVPGTTQNRALFRGLRGEDRKAFDLQNQEKKWLEMVGRRGPGPKLQLPLRNRVGGLPGA